MYTMLPNISLKHLHCWIFVKVDIFYDKLHSMTELVLITKDGQGVQGVNEGEWVVTKDVIDVDVGSAHEENT